jgi:hypothetical protein
LNIQNEVVVSEFSPSLINQLSQVPVSTSTIFNQLNLNPDIEIYACCPDCLYLVGLENEIEDPEIRCESHLNKTEIKEACHSSIGKMKTSTNSIDKHKKIKKKNLKPIKLLPIKI